MIERRQGSDGSLQCEEPSCSFTGAARRFPTCTGVRRCAQAIGRMPPALEASANGRLDLAEAPTVPDPR
jgi:hypothetical protein